MITTDSPSLRAEMLSSLLLELIEILRDRKGDTWLAIVRIASGNSATIAIDEARIHVHAEGEQELAHCLEQAKAEGITVLLVAHRMSMLPIVDSLMVIQNGRIAAYGARDDVLAQIAPPSPVPIAAISDLETRSS